MSANANWETELAAAGINQFVANETLKADNLNQTFRSALGYARLCGSAPKAVGLFRPWWWDGKFTNEFKFLKDGSSVSITSLFATLPTGVPAFVESEVVEVASGQTIFLTREGKIATEAGPDDLHSALPLAKIENGKKLNVVAAVAALDATQELQRRAADVIKASEEWRNAAAQSRKHTSLAQSFAALAFDEGLPRQRLRLLGDMAQIVHLQLRHQLHDRAVLRAIESLRSPLSDSHDEISAWLKNWAKVFGNVGLRNRFFGLAPWRPAERTPSKNGLGLREWRIDLTFSGAEQIELRSSRPFPLVGGWGFSGNFTQFEDRGKEGVDSNWVCLLPRTKDENDLSVWTDSPNLSWRVDDILEE